MATLNVGWDNTAVSGNPNALNQRVSKRVQGDIPWVTTGFTPANDLATSANSTVATVVVNNVYQFKVEALCSEGGPTPNDDGVKEGIVFECIVPTLEAEPTEVAVSFSLAATSITKAILTLKKQSDDSIVGGPVTKNRVADAINHTFTGLTQLEDYYLEVQLIATVDGVEVNSSDEEYLNAVCGGNIEGYQVSTPVGFLYYLAEQHACSDCPANEGEVVVKLVNTEIPMLGKFYQSVDVDTVYLLTNITPQPPDIGAAELTGPNFTTCAAACGL